MPSMLRPSDSYRFQLIRQRRWLNENFEKSPKFTVKPLAKYANWWNRWFTLEAWKDWWHRR
jgi:hypothetical protein